MELTGTAALEAVYDLAGQRVRVTAPDPALLAATEDVLAPCRSNAPGPAGFTIALGYGEPGPVPEGIPILWDGPLPEGQPGRIGDDGERLHLHSPGWTGLVVDRPARRADITALPERAAYAGATPAMLAIECALAAAGQTLLHAACLVTPEAFEQEGAILLLAPSGTGKTTTALALAAQGWRLMTDDTAVLTRGDGRGAPAAWGLPRPLTVHRNTAMLLSWLEPALGKWNDEDEQAVAISALPPPARTADRRPRPVLATILLARSRAGPPRLRPLPRSDALIRLSTDNVGLSSIGLTTEARKRFAVIADLVVAAPVFELDVGEGTLDGIGAIVAAAIPSTESDD